jgi:hypothetical protein
MHLGMHLMLLQLVPWGRSDCGWLLLMYAGQAINFTLPDRRPLPSSFDTSIMSSEGATYHFWWSQLYNFGIASSCSASTTAHTVSKGVLQVEGAARQWEYAQGWTVHSHIWSNANVDTSEEGLYLPLAAVMQKGSTVAVLIRGTETFTDWEAGKHQEGTAWH